MTMQMKKALPLTGLLLLAGGFLLAAWVGWQSLTPNSAPYRYVLVAEGGAADFSDLQLDSEKHKNLQIRKYEMRLVDTNEEKPLAVIHTASVSEKDSVVIDWQSNLAEPVINMTGKISDTLILAEAVGKYSSEKSLILSWWDTSRRLGLLAGRDGLFGHLAKPVLVPDVWQKYKASIGAKERQFWSPSGALQGTEPFEQFADALLSEPKTGALKLRKLAKDKEAFLVLDIRDVYKLGVMRPDQFGIGFKDFAKGDIHGMSMVVKEWLKEQGYESYSLHPIEKNMVRVYFLTDEKYKDTLIVQALPFSSSLPTDLEEVNLVYQQADYWVYEIPPASEDVVQSH